MTIKRMSQTSLKAVGNHRKMMAGSTIFADMELIATTVLSSNTPTVVFTADSNWANFKHLQLRVVTRVTTSGEEDSTIFRFNGDTGANYSWHFLYGNGSAPYSVNGLNATCMYPYAVPGSTYTANAYGIQIIDILDFASSTKNKTIRALAGYSGSTPRLASSSGAWYSTAPVTSISYSSNGSWVTGSRFSLYGIRG